MTVLMYRKAKRLRVTHRFRPECVGATTTLSVWEAPLTEDGANCSCTRSALCASSPSRLRVSGTEDEVDLGRRMV